MVIRYAGKESPALLHGHGRSRLPRVLTSTLSSEQGQFFFRKHGCVDCGSLPLPGEPQEIILRKSIK